MLCLWLFDPWIPLKANIKHDVTMHKNNLEFILLISDSLIQVACNFEMRIFEKAQVTKHYVQFAFLFAHTVQC